MSKQLRDKVFISYSHKDKEWLQKLETILQPLVSKGKITLWDDTKIGSGDQWNAEIINALETTRIAVLLISGNFLASEYITKTELPAILAAAEKKECVLFWILIDDCLYEEYGLNKFQAAHDIKHPLAALKSTAEAKKILAEIAREISRIYPSPIIVKKKQIKILSITASPDDENMLLYESEQDTMLNAFQGFNRDEVYLDMPDPVKSTMDEIKERLEDGKHDILHITAHGNINDNNEGFLCFEDHRGKLETVTGSQLAEVLKGLNPAPVIVILSACHSASREPDLMPTARVLFDAGIAAVIGMNKSVSHAAAIEFNAAFFTALIEKKPLKDAFAAGKDEIFKGEQRRIKEIPNWNALKEYEIPQLLARDENLGVESFSDYRIEAPGRPQSHHFQGAKYLERGFIGRRQVLREIFKAIDNKQGAVVLKGPGGIGKSTLTTRSAANLRQKRDGYDFIIIRGDASEVKILEAISNKAADRGVAGAKEVFSASAEPIQKLGWFVENFLGPRKVMIIFDNFEENQDEARGDFRSEKESLKQFIWTFRDYLKNKESFLFFSTRYTLPGFEGPDITKDIPEFTVVEFRKMMWNGKALKRLDGKSIKTLQDEIGGNPRALELLDRIAYNEFHEREYQWEQLKDLIPELRRRIIEKKSGSDDFAPLFLDKLFSYLSPEQRLIMEIFSIYRNHVPVEAVKVQGVEMARHDRKRLADLSLLECIEMEKGQLYYVHRLTAQYLLDPMEMAVKNKYHLQAAHYFEKIRTEEGKKYIDNDIEVRWHFLQAGEWDKAAEITFTLEEYLTLHGFPQKSMELLHELEGKKLDDINCANVYNQIGNLLQGFGDYEAALTQYRRALDILEKIGNIPCVSKSLHNIGAIYHLKGETDVALTHYEKAKENFEKIGDNKGVSAILNNIGMIYQLKGDVELALIQYQKSLEMKEKIGDSKGVSASLLQIGMIYQDKGDYEAALTQYEKAREIFEIIGDIKGVATSLHQIGWIYQDKGNYEAALTQYRKSLEITEKIGDSKGVSTSLHHIGVVDQGKGDIDAALIKYRKSLEIREKIGDIQGVAQSLHQIGMIDQFIGDYEAALTQFRKSLEICEKIGDIKGVAQNLHQIGIIYQLKGDYDGALTQYRKSFEIAEKIGNIYGLAIIKGQMGKLYFQQQEFETALKYSIQAFTIFSRIGSPEADKAKNDIALCRENMPEEQFKAILKENGMMNDE
ncbi:MAG: tetratricopeptide repeat protein [Candidatus Aminicenantes bacterium]|nr:tetratricopeptide repeat protein [Candidatus Aminicenantes bacterium]